MACGTCAKIRSFFSRPKLDKGNAGFDERSGTFHIVYERKSLPDPGASLYAYETLGLSPFAPSGPSVRNRRQIVPTAAPVYALNAVPLVGIPTTAGQIYGQPLFNPQQGYARDPFAAAVNPATAYNIPASQPDYPNASQPNITDRTRIRQGF